MLLQPQILPRQGEVSPKGDGGGGHGTEVIPFLPLRLASASHLPLAGEDYSLLQRGAGGLDARACLAQQRVRGRIADAERRAEAERRALHDGDLRIVEQIADHRLVGVDSRPFGVDLPISSANDG